MSHIDLLLNFKYICITWCIVHSFILKATPHAYASQHTSLTCKYKLFDFVLWMLFKVTFLYFPLHFRELPVTGTTQTIGWITAHSVSI